MYEYEATIIELINSRMLSLKVAPLILGGVSSSGGGVGGPPGGFIGYLPQTQMAYDYTELATDAVPESGASLLDNLNHIRYMITTMSGGGGVVISSGGGGHIVENEGTPLPQRANLNFVGTVVEVTDDPTNNATVITITAGSGGGDVYGPATNSDSHIPQWDGANSKTLKDGLSLVTTIGTPGTDTNIPTEQAVREALATVSGGGGGGNIGFQILTPGTNVDWDLSLGSARITVSGTMQMNNPTNMGTGNHYFLSIVQDAENGFNHLTWDTAYKWPFNVKPTLSTTKGKEDIIPFESDGSYLYGLPIINNVSNFNPALDYLTNILGWFKADAGCYTDDTKLSLCGDSGDVHVWEDQSGNGYDIAQTTEYCPSYHINVLNSLPVVRFDSSHYEQIYDMNSVMDGGDNCTFFFVIIPAQTDFVGLFDAHGGTMRQWPGGVWDWFDNDPQINMGVADLSPVLLTISHKQDDGRTLKVWKNGVLVDTKTSVTTTIANWDGPRFGSIGENYQFYNGDMAEILVYSESMEDTNRESVEAYLLAKYGI